jgi:hypothetical protein
MSRHYLLVGRFPNRPYTLLCTAIDNLFYYTAFTDDFHRAFGPMTGPPSTRMG